MGTGRAEREILDIEREAGVVVTVAATGRRFVRLWVGKGRRRSAERAAAAMGERRDACVRHGVGRRGDGGDGRWKNSGGGKKAGRAIDEEGGKFSFTPSEREDEVADLSSRTQRHQRSTSDCGRRGMFGRLDWDREDEQRLLTQL